MVTAFCRADLTEEGLEVAQKYGVSELRCGKVKGDRFA